MMKQFLRLILSLFSLCALAGAADFAPAETPEFLSCPLGWSQLVQKKAGLSSYPTYCTMPSCRPASASSHGHATSYGTNPLCNPVTGANCGTVLYWHYDYVLSGSSSGACPADVVGGPWSTKSN
jgi:hypothetical protein